MLNWYDFLSKFRDEFVQDLGSGGQEVAALLKKSVEDFIQVDGVSTLPPDYRIVVRVYVNMIGLSKSYNNAGILETSGDFERFARGFNKTYPLIEIVDAGNEKECADDKIRRRSQNSTTVSGFLTDCA